MQENLFNKNTLKIHNNIQRDSRPKSSKAIKFNPKFGVFGYSGKIAKNETKLVKMLLSKDCKIHKIHNFYKEKNKEAEDNKLLMEDKLKIKQLEEKINQQKKIIEEKKIKIKKINENNEKLKNSIKEKENNINNIKKSIEDFKKLNEDLENKISNINDNRSEMNNSSLDNSNYFNNSREREEAMNYLLSMMANLGVQQQYPNVDNMTYEELLELEEKMGKVSKGLNDEEIKNLKQEKFIKNKFLEEKCIICQFDFKELETIIILPCNHCFHFDCIKPWIIKEHYCPLCKKDIRVEKK